MSYRKSDYKDLEKWRKTAREGRRKNYARGNFSEGKPHEWTVEEINLVLAHEMPDRELAAKLKTSVQAIQICRCRSKKRKEGTNEQERRSMQSGRSAVVLQPDKGL